MILVDFFGNFRCFLLIFCYPDPDPFYWSWSGSGWPKWNRSKRIRIRNTVYNSKIFLKGFFFHKKNCKFEKYCEAKKIHKGITSWRRKNVNKKIKIEGVAFISKFVFSFSYFEKCFYMQSLPTANFTLVWPNFCTP